MRILFLSHYFPPEVNAPASRTYEHCRVWTSRGHDVSVLTCVPNHPTGKVYPGYRNGIMQRGTVAGINVYRMLTYVAPNKGFVRRTLNYTFYLLMAIFVAPFLPRTDVVISTSPQFFCGLAGYFVSRIKRVPWVLEIRDIWPESIVAVGAMRKSVWIRFLEWLEAFAYRHADHVVVVTESFRTHIEARGVSPAKITVIKNGVDLGFFSPRSGASDVAEELGLSRKFVVSYVGTHGVSHGLETVLEAASLLRSTPDIVFLLVGDGARREAILRQRDEMELTNVIMLGQQPKVRMPGIWSATAVSLVLLRDQPLFRSVIPSKIFESMAMMKPIILGVAGESQRILDASGAGICIRPENARELAQAVRDFHADAGRREAMGRAGRDYAEANADRTRLAERYEALLEGLVGAVGAVTAESRK
ncbi:MAG: glycosyltransferase family 4 protein [Gammaproteobacteria bacterium]|nr:glycosyltransferase family 4 protein [Gammaproteobacteria bacterium]